ncbi:MAG: amidohydrolase [Planctomycetota bacterium]|nr:amidohydrolase [Planctomycetota bacterium]
MTSALAALLAVGLAAPQGPVPSPLPAHDWNGLAVRGGHVWTGAAPWARDADIHCRHRHFASAAGTAPSQVLIELPDAAFVMPGLQDAHGHLLGLGSSLVEVNLVGTRSLAVVVEKARAAAAKLPAGAWVVGRGWDQNDWGEKRMPHHRSLSAAVPDHPVWLTRIDGHAGLANQRALAAAGITRSSVAPSGGEILFDDDGEPLGVLVDAAMSAVPEPALGGAEIRRRLLIAQEACLRHGLTCVHDMGVSQLVLDQMVQLHREKKWFLRTYVMLAPTERELIKRGPWQTPDGVIIVRGVKAYADGALGSRGAALLEPYTDRPTTRGLVSLPKGAILALAQFCADHDMQLATHAIGDKANRAVLDAYEAVAVDGGIAGRRFRVEHAQVVAAADFERFQALGVLPSMQPTHLTSDMPWAPDRLGTVRVMRAYAWRTFQELDVLVPFGSDFPVESVDPRRGIYSAVTTKPVDGGLALRPDQQLPRARALRGFTYDAAYGMHSEQRLGTIELRKYADLTVFDRNLLTCSERELLEAKVLLTVVGGRIVYDGRGE